MNGGSEAHSFLDSPVVKKSLESFSITPNKIIDGKTSENKTKISTGEK
jgi:hypothetical protein